MNFLRNRIEAFKYAWKGLVVFFVQENSAKVHGIAAILVIALGFYFDVSRTEWLILLLTIALVFATEILNTAIEEMVDLMHPEQSPKAGKVKDIAAGAVLVVSVIAVVVAVLVFVF